MWTFVGKLTLVVSAGCYILFLQSCSGASNGFAPGAATVVTPPTTLSNIKYGQIITSSNNWEVTMDNADFVENKVLPSGWSVEVKYE